MAEKLLQCQEIKPEVSSNNRKSPLLTASEMRLLLSIYDSGSMNLIINPSSSHEAVAVLLRNYIYGGKKVLHECQSQSPNEGNIRVHLSNGTPVDFSLEGSTYSPLVTWVI